MKLIKIAFLDRDGVINSSRPNNDYVDSLKNFCAIKLFLS
jgi:histidinol phosphatase-like enzyme